MRVAIIGVGLIGGSIGMALRERLPDVEVVGWDRSAEAVAAGVERRALSSGASSVEEALDGAEAAFAAAPVGALPATVAAVLEAAGPDCVVSDVGSTKRAVARFGEDPRFVGGHPLAGAETAGVAHARADLFDGATWYLTPAARTTGELYERLHRLIVGIGARPTAIDPETHDTLLASVSHLPHVFANVLVAQAAQALAEDTERMPATGPSFRDATRVAGANSAIWTDIYLANRDALIDQLDQSIARLEEFRAALAAEDAGEITVWNDAAAADRRRLLEAQLAGGPVVELRVSVPNIPGVIARLALELGRGGVNISDMALYPAPDGASGVVALWIAGEDAAGRALALVQEQGYPVTRA